MYSEEVCGWVGCCLNWELMRGGQGEVGSEGWDREGGRGITLQQQGEWEEFSFHS